MWFPVRAVFGRCAGPCRERENAAALGSSISCGTDQRVLDTDALLKNNSRECARTHSQETVGDISK